MPELETYLFIHIPKTAGTSFRLAVEETFGPERVLYDYSLEYSATSEAVREHVYAKPDLEALRAYMVEHDIVLLGGHVTYAKYRSLFPPDRVIAFLRDPITRLVAEHRHLVRMENMDCPLLEFAARPRNRSLQTTMLKGAPVGRARFVGITERYGESLDRLNELLGWQLPELVRNTNPERAEFGLDYDLSADEVAELRRRNSADYASYEKAERLLAAQSEGTVPRRQYADVAGTGVLRGVLDHYRDGRLSGWALLRGDDRPVQVQVIVDGILQRQVVADRMRPDLQKKGVHPTGRAGFSVQLGQLVSGTQVRCIIDGTDHELVNSPMTIE